VNKGDNGWQDADGQLNWAGGLLGYPTEGRIERANLPPMVAKLTAQDGRLQIDLTNTQQERMGNVYLSKDKMVEVQLMQRLLLNVEGYHGQAGLDTAVVTTRQPLSSMSTP
jgi:general secretion pathway protein N